MASSRVILGLSEFKIGPCNPAGTAIEDLRRKQVRVRSVYKIKGADGVFGSLLHEHDNEPYRLEYGPIIAVA